MRFGGLPLGVVLLVAPAEVHGVAGFPGAVVGLDLVLGRGEVAGQAVAVVDDDVGLEFEDHLVHLFGAPLLGGERLVDVVPEDVDLAVVGHQLADEAVGVVDKALAGFGVGFAADAVGVVPVHERVVEADAEAFGAGGFDELADEVAPGALLHGVVVGELGVPHAEAFVVLGGHHHVLLSGAFGEAGPLAGGVGFRREVLGEDFILRNGNALGFHDPLLVADDAVEAPVDEHAELGFAPPGEAAGAGGDLLATIRRASARSAARRPPALRRLRGSARLLAPRPRTKFRRETRILWHACGLRFRRE